MSEPLLQSSLLWRVRLFEGPVLADAAGNEVSRFRSRRVGALLAYLALNLGRLCPREELYEAIWPEDDLQLVRNRLRVALASLRRQMEPSGAPFGAVIDVGMPGQVRLRAQTVWCDVPAFEAAIREGRPQEAARLARGVLLPGYYDEWAISARERCEALRDGLEPASESASIPPMPAISAPAQPSNHRLPPYLTRFYGRQVERDSLLHLLDAHRLVTITGPGGIGKTRLAVETARGASWPAIFVPLTDLAMTDAHPTATPEERLSNPTPNTEHPTPNTLPAATPMEQRLCEAILRALLLPPGAADAREERLIAALQGRGPTLLLLDNTERLIDPVAALALRLLTVLPDLRLLVTGRLRLDVYGEALLPLRQLEIPVSPPPLEQLVQLPAAALFLDRARAALPDFALAPRHADALYEICRRLEGIPLALELAAAHVTAQSLEQIVQSLRQDNANLKSRQKGRPERHRSLRAVIETTLELLPQEARAFLFTLARFQGRWTVERAQLLTGSRHCEEFLELLVNSSLLERRENEQRGVVEFSCLETIRQFILQTYPDEAALSDTCAADNLLVNGSFEADRPSDAWLNMGGALFPFPFVVPAGWQGVDSVNVNVPGYAAFPRGIPDGANTAVVGDHTRNAGRLFQDVEAVVTPGTTCVLGVWVGSRVNYSGTGRVRLETTAGRLLADSGVVKPEAGMFERVELTYTADADFAAGERLRVVLEYVDGNQINFDDARLTVVPPASGEDAPP
jgi:predicted ATPase